LATTRGKKSASGKERGPGNADLEPGALLRGVARAAPIAAAGLAAVFAFRKLDDFDTWWHLAAGRWIVRHGAVPTSDTLSHTARDHVWTNLAWAFDVAIFLIHAAAGPAGLALAAASGYAAAVWLLARLIRPHLGTAGAGWLALAAVMILQERFAVRPEMVSFPLLAAVLWVLDDGRRNAGRRLPLLVPLMIVWVNAHPLFVIGAFAIVAAILGASAARLRGIPRAVRDGSGWDPAAFRRLAIWGSAALAATVVNPFGVRGVVFPAQLLSLIGKSDVALESIGEFRSPFAGDVIGVATAVYKVLLFAGAAVALAAFAASSRERHDSARGKGAGVDLAGLLFATGVAALSAVARRNEAIFALGALPFLARCAATTAARLPARVREAGRAWLPHAGAAATCVAALLAGTVVTGAFYRWDRQPREFGAGILEGTFPVRAAAFAREAKLPGKLYNDLAAGGYLAWDDPIGDGVFVDGRLEVYGTRLFSGYVRAMYDPVLWEAEARRYGIATAIVFHRWESRRLLVERLVRSGEWSLVYADEVAAVFVKTRGNEEAIARAGAAQEGWNRVTREELDRPVPRWGYPAGRIEGTRAFARLLATLGDDDAAAEAYERLVALGVPKAEEIEVRLLLAKHDAGAGRRDKAGVELRRVLDLDPYNAEAQQRLRALPGT
jgi:hypothetical protein